MLPFSNLDALPDATLTERDVTVTVVAAGYILKLLRVFAHSGQFGGLTLVLARWRLKGAFIKFCMKRPIYKDLGPGLTREISSLSSSSDTCHLVAVPSSWLFSLDLVHAHQRYVLYKFLAFLLTLRKNQVKSTRFFWTLKWTKRPVWEVEIFW